MFFKKGIPPMTLTFDNAYVLDVLDVAFNHSIKNGLMTPQIAELLKEQEKNNLITDDNAHLTIFGKALFKQLNIIYTSQPTDDGYIYTLTFVD
jgi:hypothetical protein